MGRHAAGQFDPVLFTNFVVFFKTASFFRYFVAATSVRIAVEAELNEEDEYEVRVYDEELNRQLVAAIEIVSPSNKDRPEKRDIFIGKVAALLRREVCVSIIDLVSTRHANLHEGLLSSLGRSDPQLPSKPHSLYAVTLRTRNFPERKQTGSGKFFWLYRAWWVRIGVSTPQPLTEPHHGTDA